MSDRRPAPTSDGLKRAELYSAAQRLGGWVAPAGDERAKAVAMLREIMGERTDLAVEAAGVRLGSHPPGTVTHEAHVIAARLLLEAAGVEEDAPEVLKWAEEGADRRRRHWRRIRPG